MTSSLQQFVESRGAISSSDRFPSKLFWHDGTRRGSTDRSTGPYRCTIDVRTPWARHGVPTGPQGPRRDPTDPRRTAGGTVGPRFIGASPVWAARSSYWRSRCYLLNSLATLHVGNIS